MCSVQCRCRPDRLYDARAPLLVLWAGGQALSLGSPNVAPSRTPTPMHTHAHHFCVPGMFWSRIILCSRGVPVARHSYAPGAAHLSLTRVALCPSLTLLLQNVPAYIFTLLSKRGKTAKQAAAAKGAVCIKDGLATPAHIQPSPFLLPHAATPFAPVAQPHPATFPGARGFGPYAAVAANPHPAALVGTGMHLPAMYASAPMHPAYRTAPASQPQPLAAMVAPLPPQAAPRLGLHPVEAARLASMSLAAGSPPHSQAFHHHSMHPAYVNLSAMHAGNPAYATAAAAPQYRAYPSNAHLHAVHSAPLPNPSAATSQASGPLSLLFYPSASLGSEGLPIEPQLSGMVAAHPQPVAVSMAAAPPVTQAGGAAFSFGAPHAAVVASAAGGGGTTLEAGSGKEAMLSGSQPTVFYQISG